MNGNTKTIQIEERTFLIQKMNAKSSLKLAKTLLAKAVDRTVQKRIRNLQGAL